MIVICLDLCRMRAGRLYYYIVIRFFTLYTEAFKLGYYGRDSVTLLNTDMADTGDADRPAGEGGDGSQGNGLVGTGGHVDS